MSCRGLKSSEIVNQLLCAMWIVENLNRLGYRHPQAKFPQEISVGLILNGITSEFVGFVRNYNMHNMGKTIGELHALLIEYEKGLPKKAVTPQVLAIQDYGILVSKNNVLYFNAIPRDGIYEIDMLNLVSNVNSIYNVSNKRAKLNLDTYLSVAPPKEYEDLSTKSSQGSAFLSKAFRNLCHLKGMQRLGMFVLVLLYPIKLSRAEVAPSAQYMTPGKTVLSILRQINVTVCNNPSAVLAAAFCCEHWDIYVLAAVFCSVIH
ncbi:hypothetical protein Tco_0030754 [Tanacetum coccineum]